MRATPLLERQKTRRFAPNHYLSSSVFEVFVVFSETFPSEDVAFEVSVEEVFAEFFHSLNFFSTAS